MLYKLCTSCCIGKPDETGGLIPFKDLFAVLQAPLGQPGGSGGRVGVGGCVSNVRRWNPPGTVFYFELEPMELSCSTDLLDPPLDFHFAKEALLLYLIYFSVLLACS